MAARKTLEEYQIQDIATAVVNTRLTEIVPNFVQRGEYDVNKTTTDNKIDSVKEDVTALKTKDEERDKDKRAIRLQMIGLGMGVALSVVIWVIAASNGLKVGV